MSLPLAAARPAAPSRRPASLWSRIAFAHDVWRQRRALAALDAAALADLGLDAGAAAAEARRPLWDLPRP